MTAGERRMRPEADSEGDPLARMRGAWRRLARRRFALSGLLLCAALLVVATDLAERTGLLVALALLVLHTTAAREKDAPLRGFGRRLRGDE